MLRLAITRLFETYFRHPLLYLMPIALMLALAAAFAIIMPPKHESLGRLLIEKDTVLAALTASPNAAPVWRTPADVTASELNQLLVTEAFARAVIAKTPLQAGMSGTRRQQEQMLDNFRKAVSVRMLGDKVVEVSAKDESPETAQQIAAATLETYIQWQINKNYQESTVAQQFFANVIKPYQDDLQRARDALAGYLEANPAPRSGDRPAAEQVRIAQLQADIDRAEERVTSAMKNEESARLSVAKAESLTRQTYVVIDAPEVPEDRVQWGKIARNSAIFVAAGIALSLAALALATLLDRTLRFPIDVRHATGLPTLAVVPAAGGRRTPGAPGARGAQLEPGSARFAPAPAAPDAPVQQSK